MSTTNLRRQRQPNSTGLTYDSLEPRCVLTGPHQVFVPLPDGINLVQNEALHRSQDTVTGLYTAQQVPGWNGVQCTTLNSVQEHVPISNLIRVRDFPGNGTVMDLDATTSVDQVYQDVPTTRGQRYLISFDSRPSSLVYIQNQPESSTQFEVYWNGVRVATVQPRYHWKTNTLEVFGGNGDFSRLTFSETLSTSGDRIGALINRIRVVKAREINVTNGGFEQLTGSVLPNSGYAHQNGTVPGWSASAPLTRNISVLQLEPARPHPKFELGYRVLNLNVHENLRDSVSQNLDTVPGALYYVRFDAQGDATNELRIRWGNTLALIARPNTQWESIGLLINASSLKTNLTFIEGAANTADIRIDNLRIFRIDSPTAFPGSVQPI